MWNPTPWMVSGARHAAAVGRLVSYAAFGDVEGIVTPTDLKVTALGSPGGAVNVAPGGAIILNRYPGSSRESYVWLNESTHQVAIAATTSAGGRTDLIVARVRDPEFDGGLVVPDPLNFQYIDTHVIQGVSSAVTSAEELNLNYPAVALAKVTLPASTSAVTSGMITDLRQLARPREHREIRMSRAASTSHAGPIGTTNWALYNPTVFIPKWATYVYVFTQISSVLSYGDLIDGWIGNGIGALGGAGQIIDIDQSGPQRNTWALNTGVEVPSNMRGTTQIIKTYISLDRGQIVSDGISQVSHDVQFYERPL